VRERGPETTSLQLQSNQDQTGYLLDLVKRVPDAEEKLKPVIEAQTALAALDKRIEESTKAEQTAAADEARDRENLTASRETMPPGACRRAQPRRRSTPGTRKQTADLETQKSAAVEKLNNLIAGLSFDWSVTEK